MQTLICFVINVFNDFFIQKKMLKKNTIFILEKYKFELLRKCEIKSTNIGFSTKTSLSQNCCWQQ